MSEEVLVNSFLNFSKSVCPTRSLEDRISAVEKFKSIPGVKPIDLAMYELLLLRNEAPLRYQQIDV